MTSQFKHREKSLCSCFYAVVCELAQEFRSDLLFVAMATCKRHAAGSEKQFGKRITNKKHKTILNDL